MEHQDNRDGLRERERDVDGVQGVESLHPHHDAAEHPGNEGDRDVDAAQHDRDASGVGEFVWHAERMVDQKREQHGSPDGK